MTLVSLVNSFLRNKINYVYSIYVEIFCIKIPYVYIKTMYVSNVSPLQSLKFYR